MRIATDTDMAPKRPPNFDPTLMLWKTCSVHVRKVLRPRHLRWGEIIYVIGYTCRGVANYLRYRKGESAQISDDCLPPRPHESLPAAQTDAACANLDSIPFCRVPVQLDLVQRTLGVCCPSSELFR